MLLLSRHYALAAEEQRAEQLAALESDLLTPEERAQGIRLAPTPRRRRIVAGRTAQRAVANE